MSDPDRDPNVCTDSYPDIGYILKQVIRVFGDLGGCARLKPVGRELRVLFTDSDSDPRHNVLHVQVSVCPVAWKVIYYNSSNLSSSSGNHETLDAAFAEIAPEMKADLDSAANRINGATSLYNIAIKKLGL